MCTSDQTAQQLSTRPRRSFFTAAELQEMDPSALELQLVVAQRIEPVDEDFLRDVVTGKASSACCVPSVLPDRNAARTAINMVALRGRDESTPAAES